MIRRRFALVATVWALLLVAGYAVVLGLGAPPASADAQLEAAMHPVPPVTQAAAEAAADTIVRLGYPAFGGAQREVRRADDLGIERWVISYTDTTSGTARGLRISIVAETGLVEVSTYP